MKITPHTTTVRSRLQSLKYGLLALCLMTASAAQAETVVHVSLNANGTSRWYDYFSNAYGQINLEPDGLYDITNNNLYGPADVFPNEGNWANVGTLTLDGTVTGTGVETLAIVGASFDFDQYIADDDAIISQGYVTQMGAISAGTVTFTHGVVTSIEFISGITFIYDFTAFGAGPLPFSGTLSITNSGFELNADSSYPSGFGGDIRFAWDAHGTAEFFDLPQQPVNFVMNQEATHVAPSTRGAPNSTHYGWDVFEHPNTYTPAGTALNDATPDLGKFYAGARFQSLHTNLNRAPSSGNFYSGASSATAQVAEQITVVTRGTPGTTGKTTVIAQLVGSGVFPSSWTFSEINGVEPEVIAGRNSANRSQVWVKWELPGNAPTYQFTLGVAPHPTFGQAHMSFDKLEIDTFFDASGASQGDTMVTAEPVAITHVMDQNAGSVTPSSRGQPGTTYFGWDTFGNPGPASVINDNTPDIGSDPTGLARFRTTNGEIHQFSGGGNLYLLTFIPGASLTLAEEITVPTNGEVGEDGFTTIMLQISSATGAMAFAGPITVGSINGVEAEMVQAASTVSAQFWAKWVLPGNQKTYTISISGVPNQQHYSFDKVVVDTKFSRYAPVGDTMKATEVVGEFALSAQAYTSAQNAANVDVTVTRTGGTVPASVTLSTSDGATGTVPPFAPAQAGVDYEALSTLVEFGAGETSKVVSVTLLPRTGNLPNRRFNLTLSAPVDGATLGAVSAAEVRIIGADSRNPTLAVRTPAANASMLNQAAPYAVTGTAGDAAGIDRVEVVLNGGSAVTADLGSATRPTSVPWSAGIMPAEGANEVVVTAYDLSGNSTSVTRSFSFVRRHLVQVSRTVPSGFAATPDSVGVVTLASSRGDFSSLTPRGASTQTGAVTPGRVVTLIAKSASGYANTFSHWVGLPAGASVEAGKATFVMPAQDVTGITAVFIANPFGGLDLRAPFFGILEPEAGTASSNATHGSISASLTATSGSLSGKIFVDGKSHSFAGTVRGDGTVWLRQGAALVQELALPNDKTLMLGFASGELAVSLVGTSGAQSSGVAESAHSKANPVPSGLLNRASRAGGAVDQGFYTLALPAKEQTPVKDAMEYPRGTGYGSITLATNGTMKVAGVLADGTKFTSSSPLVVGGVGQVHAQLTTPGTTTKELGGSLLGTLVFDTAQANSDVSGTDLLWLRPAVTEQSGSTTSAIATQAYTAGWPEGVTLDAIGAFYDRSITVQAALAAEALLGFELGKLISAVEVDAFTIAGSSVAKNDSRDRSFTLSFTQATGLMRGVFSPMWTNPADRLPSFQGVLLQKGANKGGWGFFLSNRRGDLDPESGVVTLDPSPTLLP